MPRPTSSALRQTTSLQVRQPPPQVYHQDGGQDGGADGSSARLMGLLASARSGHSSRPNPGLPFLLFRHANDTHTHGGGSLADALGGADVIETSIEDGHVAENRRSELIAAGPRRAVASHQRLAAVRDRHRGLQSQRSRGPP